MSSEKLNPTDDFIRIQDLFHTVISKWYWFVMSLLAALALVVLYLMVTPPTYTRSASILIKDDSKGASAGSIAGFDELGIFKTNTNVNNELLTLKSPTLMREVVMRLDLDKKYIVKQRLRKVDLYKESPVLVTFKEHNEQSLQFDMVLGPGGKLRLFNFFRSGEKISGEVEGSFSDTIATPVGVLMVTPTPFYSEMSGYSEIYFTKGSLQNVVNGYSNALQAVLGTKESTVINLTIKNSSRRRAEDILNTLIAV